MFKKFFKKERQDAELVAEVQDLGYNSPQNSDTG